MKRQSKGRKDHYLPQGYLRGFIAPDRLNKRTFPKPLFSFDINKRRWQECSTSEIGFVKGFYDYAGNVTDAESADDTFAELERNFSLVRGALIEAGFSNWQEHREFLLRYMQMIRVRSPLYFQQKHAEGQNLEVLQITEISEDRRSIKYIPSRLTPQQIKNKTIADMRAELQKGADWLNGFDWALRFCDSPDDPCISSDAPFIVEGKVPNLGQAIDHPDTLLIFPLCWQACLYGSRLHFDVKTDKFSSHDLNLIRRKYRANARRYLISPRKLEDLNVVDPAFISPELAASHD